MMPVDKGKSKAVDAEEKKDKDGKPVKDEKVELPPGMRSDFHFAVAGMCVCVCGELTVV